MGEEEEDNSSILEELRAVAAISSLSLGRTGARGVLIASSSLAPISNPFVLGGLGVRSASRVCVAAYWASWADCLPMIQATYPEVANMFLEKLEGWPDTPFLGAGGSFRQNSHRYHGI